MAVENHGNNRSEWTADDMKYAEETIMKDTLVSEGPWEDIHTNTHTCFA